MRTTRFSSSDPLIQQNRTHHGNHDIAKELLLGGAGAADGQAYAHQQHWPPPLVSTLPLNLKDRQTGKHAPLDRQMDCPADQVNDEGTHRMVDRLTD
jgi:hypothetical protein